METTEDEKGASTSWRRRAAQFFWFLLVSPILFFLFLYALPFLCTALVMVVVSEVYFGVVFHYRVSRSRRYLRWRAARELIQTQGGTLIFESPTIGWGARRFWWTLDRVHELAPCCRPTQEEYDLAFDEIETPEWDRWFYDNYLSLETGRAMYVGVRANKRRLEKLQAEFPDLQIAETGLVMVGFRPRKLDEEVNST